MCAAAKGARNRRVLQLCCMWVKMRTGSAACWSPALRAENSCWQWALMTECQPTTTSSCTHMMGQAAPLPHETATEAVNSAVNDTPPFAKARRACVPLDQTPATAA